MNVKILSILVSSLLFISGCTKKIETLTTCVPKTPLSISQIEPVSLLPVRWIIITPENSDAVFKELENKKVSLALFGLTDDNYENLAINMANIRKYITDQNAVIKSYKNYYETPETQEIK